MKSRFCQMSGILSLLMSCQAAAAAAAAFHSLFKSLVEEWLPDPSGKQWWHLFYDFHQDVMNHQRGPFNHKLLRC